jgi:hypothetical protein
MAYELLGWLGVEVLHKEKEFGRSRWQSRCSKHILRKNIRIRSESI